MELNEAAARLLPAGQKGLPGHPLLPCFPELAHLAASLSEGREEKEVVYLGKKPIHCTSTSSPPSSTATVSSCSPNRRVLLRKTVLSWCKKNSLPAKYHFSDILGHSPAVQKAIRLAQYYSGTDETILILGRAAQARSCLPSPSQCLASPSKPFVAVNCAAIPDT